MTSGARIDPIPIRHDPETGDNRERPARGRWAFLHVDEGREALVIRCKGCGARGELGDEYVVGSDGAVEPVLACEACGFRAYVRLADWNREPYP